MISKVLIRLIDQAILPAVVLLSARVFSIILFSKYFNLQYNLSSKGFEYASFADYVKVNSYSTFAMFFVMFLAFFYILLKSFHFHDTHITPSLTAKVFSVRMQNFIQNSFEIYSQALIWMLYLYLLLIVSGIMVAFGLLYTEVFLCGLVLSITSTVFLILDIEEEIKIDKEIRSNFKAEENLR